MHPQTVSSTGVVIASFPEYLHAQAVVDRLSDAHFEVERTAIVGRDLRLVENVVARLNYGRAALTGAAAGAWFGLLVGLFIALFGADSAASLLALVLWGIVFGAAAGALFSLTAYALTGGRRDFVSVSQLVAAQYDVVVDGQYADEARHVLGIGPAPTTTSVRTAARTPAREPAPGPAPDSRRS